MTTTINNAGSGYILRPTGDGVYGNAMFQASVSSANSRPSNGAARTNGRRRLREIYDTDPDEDKRRRAGEALGYGERRINFHEFIKRIRSR